MTTLDKNIIDSYFFQLEKLSSLAKLELIEKLINSLKKEKPAEADEREKLFYESFGGWGDDKPAEEIIREIRESRRFRKKDLKL